ncbi:MAG: hypothetical protein ACXIU8_01315 [Alkalilacustris sp.]
MQPAALLWLSAALVGGLVAALVAVRPDLSDHRVQQAALAGAVVGVGWFVTFILREFGAVTARTRRRQDVELALRAEIFDYTEALDDGDPVAEADALRDVVLAAGDKRRAAYLPYFPRISPPVVFEAVRDDLPTVSSFAMDSIVQFYSMLSDITSFAEDLRSPEFQTLPAARRVVAYADYLEMRGTTVRIGLHAIDQLNLSLRRTSDPAYSAPDHMNPADAARMQTLRAEISSRSAVLAGQDIP